MASREASSVASMAFLRKALRKWLEKLKQSKKITKLNLF
jgi:uncharacterized membrane protein YdjX (TVP38/TMEM64 family)